MEVLGRLIAALLPVLLCIPLWNPLKIKGAND
jgi:hypothetical protein